MRAARGALPWWVVPLVALGLCAGCAGPVSPSDDPNDWEVDTTRAWEPVVSEPDWLIPSRRVPLEARPVLASNNNVAIALHAGRLWLGWRTGPTHFASKEVRLHLMSSPDLGATWRHLLGLATSAGVGFTVALFVTSLSFDPAATADAAKVGILAGSTLAGIVGFTILRTAPASTKSLSSTAPVPNGAVPTLREPDVAASLSWPPGHGDDRAAATGTGERYARHLR